MTHSLEESFNRDTEKTREMAFLYLKTVYYITEDLKEEIDQSICSAAEKAANETRLSNSDQQNKFNPEGVQPIFDDEARSIATKLGIQKIDDVVDANFIRDIIISEFAPAFVADKTRPFYGLALLKKYPQFSTLRKVRSALAFADSCPNKLLYSEKAKEAASKRYTSLSNEVYSGDRWNDENTLSRLKDAVRQPTKEKTLLIARAAHEGLWYTRGERQEQLKQIIKDHPETLSAAAYQYILLSAIGDLDKRNRETASANAKSLKGRFSVDPTFAKEMQVLLAAVAMAEKTSDILTDLFVAHKQATGLAETKRTTTPIKTWEENKSETCSSSHTVPCVLQKASKLLRASLEQKFGL